MVDIPIGISWLSQISQCGWQANAENDIFFTQINYLKSNNEQAKLNSLVMTWYEFKRQKNELFQNRNWLASFIALIPERRKMDWNTTELVGRIKKRKAKRSLQTVKNNRTDTQKMHKHTHTHSLDAYLHSLHTYLHSIYTYLHSLYTYYIHYTLPTFTIHIHTFTIYKPTFTIHIHTFTIHKPTFTIHIPTFTRYNTHLHSLGIIHTYIHFDAHLH